MDQLTGKACRVEVEVKFHPDGTVRVNWWTPEIAAMICALCGRGGGFEKYGPNVPADLKRAEELGPCYMCATRNPYCG